MRLKKIKIIHFGQFSEQTFVLPHSALNVFYGGNEAGKSTTVAFIKQIMFGFYLRSNSTPFFEDYRPLARVSPMGGSLFFEDKQKNSFELERLWAKGDKTKRGLLTVKQNGQAVPADLFFDQIKRIDGNFYTDSFIFNQEMLARVAGLTEEQLLQRIYYLGAANSGQLLALRDDFSKRAANLFKKSGRKPKVNQLLKEVAAKRAQYQETQAQFKVYQQYLRQEKEEKTEFTAAEAKLNQLQKKQVQLEEIGKELGQFAQVQTLQKRTKPVSFNQKNYQQAQEIDSRLQNLQANIASLQAKIRGQKPVSAAKLAAAGKLVQQKAQILEWQSEFQAKQKKRLQLRTAERQLLSLYPSLKQVIELSDQQIKKMKSDYYALSPADQPSPLESNHSELYYLAGGLLGILGLIAFFSIGSIGLLALLAGAGLLIFAYCQNKKEGQKKQAAAAAREKIKKRQQEFFARYGIDRQKINLDDLLNELNQYRLRQEEAKDNEAEIQTIIHQLKEFSSRLQDQIQQSVTPNFETILPKLNWLEGEIDSRRHERQRTADLRANLKQEEEQKEKLQLQLQAVMAHDHVENMIAYGHRYQAYLQQVKLQTQIKALKDNLNLDLAALAKLSAHPQQLKEKRQSLTAQIGQSKGEIAKKRDTIAQLQVKLNDLADSTAVFTAKQELANTASELIKVSQDYLADLLAGQWLDQTLNFASNERFPKMLLAARQYLQLLTGGRYVDIDLGKRISVVRNDGRKRGVKYLSRGTAEQLYFALKLAFIAQIKDEINLPILIDDSFVNFDDRRVEYIKELLQKIASSNQVLIFTAQKELVKRLGVEPLDFKKEKTNA